MLKKSIVCLGVLLTLSYANSAFAVELRALHEITNAKVSSVHSNTTNTPEKDALSYAIFKTYYGLNDADAKTVYDQALAKAQALQAQLEQKDTIVGIASHTDFEATFSPQNVHCTLLENQDNHQKVTSCTVALRTFAKEAPTAKEVPSNLKYAASAGYAFTFALASQKNLKQNQEKPQVTFLREKVWNYKNPPLLAKLGLH